jgi:MoaA/NifB/PqqE/SkfB family radical SAM enzyme
MKKLLKQGLLRFGGYALGRNLYAKVGRLTLRQRAREFLRTGATPLPDMVMFEPTLRCNLRCKMCFQNHGEVAAERELAADQIVTFFDRHPYLKKVTLIGGEIFMRPDTNGTLIRDSHIDILKKCRRIFGINISLDGPKAVHESIRNSPVSYDRTVHVIEALARVFPVTVNCVIQNDNVTVLPDVVDLCAHLGVRKLDLELERIYSEDLLARTEAETGLARAELPVSSHRQVREYSLKTLQDALGECQSRGRKNGVYVTFDPPFLTDDIEACYAGLRRSEGRQICESLRTATIAPDGGLVHCYVIRKPFGNILDAPFEEIWNSPAANNFRKQLIMNNLAPMCENCRVMTPFR